MSSLDWTPLGVSFSLAAWTTGLLLVGCFPLAWVLARSRRPWGPFVEALLNVPLVLPPTVLGLVLLVGFSPASPLGAWLFQTFHLKLVFTFEGLVVASCIAGLPFMLGALKTGVASVPESLLEASWTLGKGTIATALGVVLPNMGTALWTGAVTTFARTLGEFGVVMMIGGSLPGMTKVVSIAIYERAEAQDWSGAWAYALVLLAVSYAAVWAVHWAQYRARKRGRP